MNKSISTLTFATKISSTLFYRLEEAEIDHKVIINFFYLKKNIETLTKKSANTNKAEVIKSTKVNH